MLRVSETAVLLFCSLPIGTGFWYCFVVFQGVSCVKSFQVVRLTAKWLAVMGFCGPPVLLC